jgi:gliding motility-associated-like protein
LLQAQVVANFSSNINKGCSPVTVKFANQSTGTSLNYRWSFGNGNLSTKENPEAIFNVPGKYEISLEVTDPSGNKSEKKVAGYITVFKNPKANLSASPTSGCAPLNVVFTNQTILGDSAIVRNLWDFGDGNTVNKATPSHIYKTEGKFNVSLVVVDINGCEDKVSLKDLIEVDRIPQPNFHSNERFNCTAPYTVNFVNTSVRSGARDTYKWDFGDGTQSTVKNPAHTYTKLGKYTVTLLVTTPSGCSVAKQEIDYIYLGGIQMDFTVSKKNICNPDEVLFTNTSKPAGLNTTWDFGDGGSAIGNSVIHRYTKKGSYDITLYVGSSPACKDELTLSNYISVIDRPIASFTHGDTTSCKIPFFFTSTSTSQNSTNLKWYRNELYSDENIRSTQIIQEFSTTIIKLVASNEYGCTDEKSVKVIVEELDIILSPAKSEGCVPLPIDFTDNSVYDDSIAYKKWVFSDGVTYDSITNSLSRTFTDTGRFTLTLYVTTADGCTGEKEVQIIVGQKTNPDFLIYKDSLCNGDQLYIQNTTKLDTPKVNSIEWFIYDGENPALEDNVSVDKIDIPSQEYAERGPHYTEYLKKESKSFDVALVTQHNGCYDTMIKEDFFFVHDPLVIIGRESFNICTDDSVLFTNESTGDDFHIWYINSSIAGYDTLYGDSVIIHKDIHGTTDVTLVGQNLESGCIDSDAQKIEFTEPFVASFTPIGNGCAPANFTFYADTIISDSFTFQYDWYIDGNASIKKITTFRQFEKAGIKNIKLVVTNLEHNCKDTAIQTVTVTGPSVDGLLTATPGCPPLPISLKSNSDPAGYDSLYWEIQGRKVMITSTGTTVDTMFRPGQDTNSYSTVRLVGIDTNGCKGYQEFPVQVTGPFTAYIKVRRLASCSSLNYIFNAEMPNYNTDDYTFSWDLGNGETSNQRIINATYPSAGIYIVKLRILGTDGCITTLTETIDINKERLNAKFSADSIATDCPPLFVQFNNKSTATMRDIKSYFWEFGDGSTSVERHPSKLYLKAGKFTVKLWIEDAWGCKDSVTYPDLIVVNGPEGSYDFDKKKGCVPLTVKYTSKTERTNFYEWDMGDGNVIKNKSNHTHTYTIPGRFIPLLILSDTFGCSYTLPPIDTIYVDPYPEPEFTYNGTCVNYPISFSGHSTNSLVGADFQWEMFTATGIDSLSGPDVKYTFYNLAKPTVRLTITSTNGCKNTITKVLNLKNLIVNFASENENNCVGTTIRLVDLTESDTTLTFTKWIIDGVEYADSSPTFFADYIGEVNITLIHENILGCIDTLTDKAIIIGDSIKPLDPEMLRVTVNDNHTIQLDYKESSFPDFKAYHLYQENNLGYTKIGVLGQRANTSFLAKGVNTLDRSYCFKVEVQNTCGLLSDTFTHLKHCTIETKAEGDTNRNVVHWSAYVGWDVAAYNVYRKELGLAGVLRKVASVSGDSLQFLDSLLYCNIEYSYKIEGEEQDGNLQVSYSDTAHAMPIWQYLPPPNKLIRATVENDKTILIEWDSVQNSIVPITTYVLEKSSDGTDYTWLLDTDIQTFSYEDEEVLVDDYSYFYRTYAIDECNDTTKVINYGKTVLLNTDTAANQRPELVWSKYAGWLEAVAEYAVEIKNEDGSFTELARFLKKDSSFIDFITDLNQRPNYCYRILAFKELVSGEPQVISVSNEDCSPVRSKIFYPNAFTPNGDNLNDRYVTPSEYIKEYQIMIFNRWGEKVYESYDLTQNWDGTYQGKEAQMDAYAVVVITTGVDNIRRVHHGTVTLLR